MIEQISTMVNFFSQIAPSQPSVNTGNLPTANVGTSMDEVLTIVFVLITIISVIFVAIGGLKYVLSNGDSNSVQSAKNTILYAVIGLVIGISAFTIVSFVAGRL